MKLSALENVIVSIDRLRPAYAQNEAFTHITLGDCPPQFHGVCERPECAQGTKLAMLRWGCTSCAKSCLTQGLLTILDAQEHGSGYPRLQLHPEYPQHIGMVILVYSHKFHETSFG